MLGVPVPPSATVILSDYCLLQQPALVLHFNLDCVTAAHKGNIRVQKGLCCTGRVLLETTGNADLSFCLSFFLIGVELLDNDVFISAVRQSESAIWTHISFPLGPPSFLPTPPLQVIRVSQVELPVLYSRFPLSFFLFYTWVVFIHRSMLLSQFVPPSLSPAASTCLFSTSVILFLPSK